MSRADSLIKISFVVLLFCLDVILATAQRGEESSPPRLDYEVVPDFFQLPPGEHFVEPAGIAVNSKGAHLRLPPRQERTHGIRRVGEVHPQHSRRPVCHRAHGSNRCEDNIWTTDVGSHVVLKLSPEGRVLLALGRMRIPGDDVLHFNQPTDLAWDRDGNIYVSD